MAACGALLRQADAPPLRCGRRLPVFVLGRGRGEGHAGLAVGDLDVAGLAAAGEVREQVRVLLWVGAEREGARVREFVVVGEKCFRLWSAAHSQRRLLKVMCAAWLCVCTR